MSAVTIDVDHISGVWISLLLGGIATKLLILIFLATFTSPTPSCRLYSPSGTSSDTLYLLTSPMSGNKLLYRYLVEITATLHIGRLSPTSVSFVQCEDTSMLIFACTC